MMTIDTIRFLDERREQAKRDGHFSAARQIESWIRRLLEAETLASAREYTARARATTLTAWKYGNTRLLVP